MLAVVAGFRYITPAMNFVRLSISGICVRVFAWYFLDSVFDVNQLEQLMGETRERERVRDRERVVLHIYLCYTVFMHMNTIE